MIRSQPRCCGNEPPFAHRASFWFSVQIDFEFLGFELLWLPGSQRLRPSVFAARIRLHRAPLHRTVLVRIEPLGILA